SVFRSTAVVCRSCPTSEPTAPPVAMIGPSAPKGPPVPMERTQMYTTRPCQPRPAAHGGAARRRQRELDATTVRRRPLPLHPASIHQAARDHRDGALVRQRTLRTLAGRECAAGAAQVPEHEELRGRHARAAL